MGERLCMVGRALRVSHGDRLRSRAQSLGACHFAHSRLVGCGRRALLGWVTAGHISDRWRRSRNGVSGFSLAGFAVLLVLSGYALYYTTDRFHDVAAVLHEVLGVVAIAFALTHWWRNAAFRSEP